MRARWTLPISLGVLLMAASPAFSDVRIMPLGDSITAGNESLPNAYRGPLAEALREGGYEIDFVGSQKSGSMDDNDHEGHHSRRSAKFSPFMYAWLNNAPADIVLIHIGTNDISAGIRPGEVGVALEEILDSIRTFSRDRETPIVTIVARIINRKDPTSPEGLAVTQLNTVIDYVVKERKSQKILLVDMEAAVQYPDDMADEIHPNAAGYEKMAAAWLPAIQEAIVLVQAKPEVQKDSPTPDAAEAP